MMNYNNLSDEEKEKLNRVAGQCNFTCLFLFCTAAFCCGITATSFCAFVSRDVTTTQNAQEYCQQQTNATASQCSSYLENHGIGFWAWQATVPVDTTVCLSYTQYVNGAYRTPTFDTKFNSARACSTVANFFGALAWFTMAFATCCPLDPARMACLSIYFFMATLFQGLSLLIFRSSACAKGFFDVYFQSSNISSDEIVESVSCSLSTGSKLAVAAIVLYFYCMCLVPKAVPPEPVNVFQQQQQQQRQAPATAEAEGDDAAAATAAATAAEEGGATPAAAAAASGEGGDAAPAPAAATTT